MDHTAITAGADAVRSGLQLLKTALDIARNARELLPEGDQKDQVGEALATAARKLMEGKTTIAHALGYSLCRCQFPPAPMLRVGHLLYRQLSGIDREVVLAQHVKAGGGLIGAVAVHVCPKCKQTDTPAYAEFTRDKQADSSMPLLAAPLELHGPPPPSSFEGWGW